MSNIINSKFVKFILLRLVSFVVNLSLIFFLVSMINLTPTISYNISSIVIFVINYLITTKFIFNSKYNYINFSKYAIAVLTIITLSSLLIEPLISKVDLNYIWASAISLSLATLLKYYIFTKYVFVNSRSSEV